VSTSGDTVTAEAPGRVNLIGDHTDYTGGWVLPMAIDRRTRVTGVVGGDRVFLRSADDPEPADVPLDVEDPRSVGPPWARYVAGVIAEFRPTVGLANGTVTTELPIGGGLASSAALEVAVALALGASGTPLQIARKCQEAEQRASGVPCGIMDQLAATAAVAGHALRINCTTHDVVPVPLPDHAEVIVVDSGVPRRLATSGYARRRAECEEAEEVIGSLADATVDDLDRLDGVPKKRARHVITENARVLDFADALEAGDLAEAGRLMVASHYSLRNDFEVSTPALDELVAQLVDTQGVWGARLTGAGFGGSLVVLAEVGCQVLGRRVRAVGPARVL
jgi:galactokinase